MRNKKVIYILITILSIIILGIIGLGLTKSTKSDVNVSLESETVSESYQQSQETQETDLLEQQEEQEEDTTYRTYATLAELVEDKNIPFVDDATFEAIKAAFEKVEFTGDFEIGNPDTYEEYKTIFQKLLLNEIPYIDNETGEEVYIQDSDLFAPDSVDVETCDYYFFDIDGDSEQELCIHYLDWDAILKYNAEKDEIVLCDLYTSDNRVWLLGTGKIRKREFVESSYIIYDTFHQYDENGNEISNTYIADGLFYGGRLTKMPKYTGEAGITITDEMKHYGAYDKESGEWYFKISLDQSYELGRICDNVCEDAQKEIKEVTYTYSEFLGQNQEYRLYNSLNDIEDDINLSYVDDVTFEEIKAAYENIEFTGEFKKGNPDTYEEYKKIFQKLLLNEIPYIDDKSGEEIYLKDGRYKESLGVDMERLGVNFEKDYAYRYFDIDGDGTQELWLYGYNGAEDYFFKYDSEDDKIYKWSIPVWGQWSRMIGTGKILDRTQGKYFYYVQFGDDGKIMCNACISFESYSEERTVYLASLPEYSEREVDVTQKMKLQGAYARDYDKWYFRLTKEQFEELYHHYYNSENISNEEIKEVTFAYEEFLNNSTKWKVLEFVPYMFNDKHLSYADTEMVDFIKEAYRDVKALNRDNVKMVKYNKDNGVTYEQLGKKDNAECEVGSVTDIENTLYMIMLPKYAEEQQKIKLTEDMMQQGVYVISGDEWYFRVTEEIYLEIFEEITLE